MKKVISCLITIMMVLTMMPYVAFADNVSDQAAAENENIALYVEQSNELYTENDAEPTVEVIDVVPFSDTDEGIAPNGSGETQYAETVEEAAAGLRSAMVERQTNVVVNIKVDELTEEALTTKCSEIFTEAIKHTGNPKEGDSLKWVWENWKCSISGTSDGSNCYATITYDITYYTTAEQEAALTSAVESLKEELNLDGKTDYEKVKAIYDYMVANISYDYTNLENDSHKLKYTAYAALINKTSVCQGYATLFYRLALEYGIDTRVIAGESLNNNGESERHAWNIVKLGDKYYNLDATWDSTWDSDKTKHDFFLKGTNTFENHTRDVEFITNEFNAVYPMSEGDYVYIAGEGGENEEPEDVPDGTEITEGDYVARIVNNKAYIINCYDQNTIIEVPQNIKGYKVVAIGINEAGVENTVFYNCKNVTKVIIPEGVEMINDRGFKSTYTLSEIVLPQSLTFIGNEAFAFTNLQNIDIPDNVVNLGYNVFLETPLSDKINYSEVVYIDNCLINVPEGYYDNYIIKEGTQCIAGAAFNFVRINQLKLPNSLIGISNDAFLYSSADTICFNEALSYIGEEAFSGLNGKLLLEISDDNNYFTIKNGALYSKDLKTLVLANNSNIDKYVIPNGVKKIGGSAFAGTSYSQIEMPDSLEYIGNSAFENSSIRGDIVFSKGIKHIGAYAFKDTAILSATFTGNINYFGEGVFRNCKEMNSVMLPDNINTIPPYTFNDCSNLKEVIIPLNVKEIGIQAFMGCKSLKSVTLNEGLCSIAWNAFEDCVCLKTILIPASVSFIDGRAFAGTDALTSFQVANGNTSYTDYYGCIYNKSMQVLIAVPGGKDVIKFPETITQIANGACVGNDCITSIIIPEAVAKVGEQAFMYCSSLNEIVILGDDTLIDTWAFSSINAFEGEDNSNRTIYAYRGSYAFNYANINGFNYKGLCDLVNHQFSEVIKRPTCTESGYTTYRCYCGYTYVDNEVDSIGHSYEKAEYIWNEDNSKVTAKSVCINDSKHIEEEIVESIYEVITPAKCGIEGKGKYVAIFTNEIFATQEKEVNIPALLHDFEGSGDEKKCKYCGILAKDHPGENHTYGNWIITIEPTCTDDGEEIRICTCGEKETRPINKLDHDYEVVKSNPTCTEKGYTTYTCKNDPEHTYIADYVDAAGHKMTFHKEVAATCEGAGNIAYYTCDVCKGYFLDEAGKEATSAEKIVTEAIGHEYEAVVTAPTCTEKGYTTYTCIKCGDTYKDDETEALGHTEEEIPAVEATCTETGLTAGVKCSICGELLTAQEETEPAGHAYEAVVTAPTCEEYGYTTYTCSVCNDSYVEDGDDPQGHDYEAVETKPTCTEGGYITYTCKRDATHTYTTDLDPDGHEMKEHAAVDATCEEAGKITYYTCNVCEGYFLDEKGEEAIAADKVVVAATGHKYGAYKTTTKAKFGKAGEQTATCSVCPDKITKPIAAPKSIQLSYTEYTYNGKIKKPTVKAVYDSEGNKISSANYKVSYASGRKNVGKYKVTVTFNKNSADYTGSSYTTFKINPKGTSISSLAKVKKGFTVKWKKQTGKMAKTRITGYQYRYSTSSKMTNAVTKTIKGYSKTSAKKTGLKAKKKYYIQVRTYKTVNGVKYYSPWSIAKAVKTK